MKTIGLILGVIGLIVLGLANIIGVGYAFYLWGSQDVPLNTSLWTAFVLWAKLIGTGLVLFFIGLFSRE